MTAPKRKGPAPGGRDGKRRDRPVFFRVEPLLLEMLHAPHRQVPVEPGRGYCFSEFMRDLCWAEVNRRLPDGVQHDVDGGSP